MEYLKDGRIRTEVESNLRKILRLDSGFDKFQRNATAILGGLVMLTSIMLYSAIKDDYQRSQRTARAQVQERRIDAVFTNVDRDEIPDLILEDHIFLADKIDEGIIYRRINESDVYRIK
ncbi:hypothetical protein J4430_03140 [Candidatus Woesearchaeota archaeon]|nr:hypothetical protein [Candidatus Woesearchaeota archaeon]